jgi:hypothetical protein
LVIALALLAFPALADEPPTVETGVPVEQELPPPDDAAPDVDLREILPQGPILEGERVDNDTLCPICILSYCARPGWRCHYTGCSSTRQCCFYNCVADASCTTKSCPPNVCFCGSIALP